MDHSQHQMEMGDRLMWTMPPHPEWMNPAMMAPFMGILPKVEPFMPGWELDIMTLPVARAPEVVELADGDTLRLDAGIMHGVVGSRMLKVYGFNGQFPGTDAQGAAERDCHGGVHEQHRLPDYAPLARGTARQ